MLTKLDYNYLEPDVQESEEEFEELEKGENCPPEEDEDSRNELTERYFSPRFIRYYFKPNFLRLKHVGATMEFVVGAKPVKKFRMIE